MLVRVLVAWLAAVALLPREGARAQGYPFAYGAPRSFSGAVSPYAYPYQPFYGTPYSDRLDTYEPYRGTAFPEPYATGGTYRTLCVRTCDGYYFPISFSTTRSGLARDADKCSATCGEGAQLFFHPNPGGDIETMTDMTGMAYSELPNAFKYRKTLVSGCQCRPQPWSEAELARHRAYAQGQPSVAESTRDRAQPATQASEDVTGPRYTRDAGSNPFPVDRGGSQYRDYGALPVASEPRVSTIDDNGVVARPAPVARAVQPWPQGWPSTGNRGWDSSGLRYVRPGSFYRY